MVDSIDSLLLALLGCLLGSLLSSLLALALLGFLGTCLLGSLLNSLLSTLLLGCLLGLFLKVDFGISINHRLSERTRSGLVGLTESLNEVATVGLAELAAVDALDHPVVLAGSLLAVSLVLLGPVVDGLTELESVGADRVHGERVASHSLRNGRSSRDGASCEGDAVIHGKSRHVLLHVHELGLCLLPEAWLLRGVLDHAGSLLLEAGIGLAVEAWPLSDLIDSHGGGNCSKARSNECDPHY